MKLDLDRVKRQSSLSWPDNYYLETDVSRREEMLKKQLETEDSEENHIRYQLWKQRYVSPRKGITGADYYMRVVMDLEKVAKDRDSFFGRRAFEKKIREIRSTFCLDLLKKKPEYVGLWMDEFIHFWSLYIETCKEDSNYGGLALGLGRMPMDKLMNKLKNDIYKKAVVLPEEMGMADELEPYTKAALTCSSYYFPER